MANKKRNLAIDIVRIGGLTFVLLLVVSGLIFLLIGVTSIHAAGLILAAAGLMVLLFAAYGFMGQSALDCDERLQFSSAGVSALDTSGNGACANTLAVGIAGGAILSLMLGLFLIFVQL